MSRSTSKQTSSVREEYTRTIENEVQETVTTQYYKIDERGNRTPNPSVEAQQMQAPGLHLAIEPPQPVYQQQPYQSQANSVQQPRENLYPQHMEYAQNWDSQPQYNSGQDQHQTRCPAWMPQQQQPTPQYQQNHILTAQHYQAEWTDQHEQVQEAPVQWQPQVQSTPTINGQWQQYCSQQASMEPQACAQQAQSTQLYNGISTQPWAETEQQLQELTIEYNDPAAPWSTIEAPVVETPTSVANGKSGAKKDTPSDRSELAKSEKARKEKIREQEKEAKELERRLRKEKEEQKRQDAKVKQAEKQRLGREKRELEREERRMRDEARREEAHTQREERRRISEERKALQEQRRAQEAQMKQEERERQRKMHQYEQGLSFEPPKGETVVTSQILKNVKITKSTGTYRREAFKQGEKAVAALDQQVQRLIAMAGACPAGFGWIPVDEGYLCAAGNHLIPEKEVDRMLETGGNHWPQVVDANSASVMLGMPRLVKPPDRVPAWVPAVSNYYEAKRGVAGALGSMLGLGPGVGIGSGLGGFGGGLGGRGFGF